MNELNHLFAAVGGVAVLLIVLVVWSLIWKGIGLWFSARNYQRAWFVAILILNTAGILEIVYLLFFRRDKQPGTKSLFEKPVAGPNTNDGAVG
jgi:divalent metal cation (Fe/Co/Zn/Cd) transporter